MRWPAILHARYQPYSTQQKQQPTADRISSPSSSLPGGGGSGGTITRPALFRPHPQRILIYTRTPRETHAASRKDSCVLRPPLRACLVARKVYRPPSHDANGKWSLPLADTTPLIMAGLGLGGPSIDNDV